MLEMFIFIYLVIFSIVIKKSKEMILNPILWLYLSWSLIIGLYFFSGINYKQKLELNTLIYILVSLLIFTIAYFYGKKIRRKKKINRGDLTSKVRSRSVININNYYNLAIIGFCMYVLDIVRLNHIVLGLRIIDLKISIVGVIGSILLQLSLVVWLYELIHIIKNNKKIRLKYLIMPIIYMVPNILTAGRQSILIFIISTFITLSYLLKVTPFYKYKKQFIMLFFGIFTIILMYLKLISAKRSMVSDKVKLFEFMLNTVTSERTIIFTEKFGGLSKVIMEFLYYYSQEIPMFNVFFNNYEGPTFWGMFQFHYISRRLPEFLMLNHNLAWVHLDLMSDKLGLYSHVWRTALAPIIIDFGKVGGLIFIFILGWLSGKIHRNYMEHKTEINLIGLVMVCNGVCFSIQYSPISEVAWAYTVFWILIIKRQNRHRKL